MLHVYGFALRSRRCQRRRENASGREAVGRGQVSFRRVRASASLKRTQNCVVQSGALQPFRGVRASASFKPGASNDALDRIAEFPSGRCEDLGQSWRAIDIFLKGAMVTTASREGLTPSPTCPPGQGGSRKGMWPVGNETGRTSVSPPRETDGGFFVLCISDTRRARSRN